MSDIKKQAIVEEVKNLEAEKCSPFCPHCGSDHVFGMSRVVGYMSVIGNWNKSKQAELKRRQDGNYWAEDL